MTLAHERLDVYQRAIDFTAWAHQLLDSLPPGLSARSQLERQSCREQWQALRRRARALSSNRARVGSGVLRHPRCPHGKGRSGQYPSGRGQGAIGENCSDANGDAQEIGQDGDVVAPPASASSPAPANTINTSAGEGAEADEASTKSATRTRRRGTGLPVECCPEALPEPVLRNGRGEYLDVTL
jgi:hypothetical protein